MAIYGDKEKLARQLFGVFISSPGFDSLSYPMQERWRELAEYVAERPCEKCEETAETHEELKSHIQQAVSFLEEDSFVSALEHLNDALALLVDS